MHNSKEFQSVHACNDGKFNSASGILININHPTPCMIHIQDIAGALAKICRFGGQTNTFYSVAQHSVLVAALVPYQYKKQALLHDAAEAYLGDVIKPLKNILGESYTALECRFDGAIEEAFNLYWSGEAYGIVKRADMQVLEMEHEALQKSNPGPLLRCLDNQQMLCKDSWAWDYAFARKMFMVSYNEIFHNI